MKTLKKLIFYIGKLISWLWIIAVVVICFGKQYVPFTVKGGLIVLLFISLPLFYLIWRSYVDRHEKGDKKSKNHQKRINKKQAKINKKEKRLSKRAMRKRKRHEKKLNKKQSMLNKFKKRVRKQGNKVSTRAQVEPVIVNTNTRLETVNLINPELNLEQSETTALMPNIELEPTLGIENDRVQMVEKNELPIEQPKIKWLPKEPIQIEDKCVYEFEKVTKLNPAAYVVLDECCLSIRHESIEGVSPALLHGPTQISYESIEKVELQVRSFPSMGTIQLQLKGESHLLEEAVTLTFTEDYLELGTRVVNHIESKLKVPSLEMDSPIEGMSVDQLTEDVTVTLEGDSIPVIGEETLTVEHIGQITPVTTSNNEVELTENNVNQTNRLTEDVVQQLKAYKELLDLDIITKEEFEKKKAEFLS
ncbi:MAG TPA: hypothetical protein DCY20_02250 [Firmicutes bacterium]|nr:hypothetical protein [Bacillota bacterium]